MGLRGDPARMEAILIEFLVPIVAFLCLIAAAAAGAFVNVRVPTRHLQDGTVEIVRIVVNIFVVMTSLVVGLMLASAKDTFETNNRNVHALATEIILLDRNLRTLGAQTDEARRHLVEYARTALNEADILQADPQAEAALDATGMSLRTIRVSDNQALAVWNDARQMYRQVERERWVVVDAAGGTIPTPLIVTSIAWLAAIFVGLGIGRLATRSSRRPSASRRCCFPPLSISSSKWTGQPQASFMFRTRRSERALAQLQR